MLKLKASLASAEVSAGTVAKADQYYNRIRLQISLLGVFLSCPRELIRILLSSLRTMQENIQKINVIKYMQFCLIAYGIHFKN